MLPRSTADLKISQISWFHFFKYLELFSSLFFAFYCTLPPAVRHLAGLLTDWRFRHFCRWLYSHRAVAPCLHHASNMLLQRDMVQVCIRCSQQIWKWLSLFSKHEHGHSTLGWTALTHAGNQLIPCNVFLSPRVILHPPRIRICSMEIRRAIDYLRTLFPFMWLNSILSLDSNVFVYFNLTFTCIATYHQNCCCLPPYVPSLYCCTFACQALHIHGHVTQRLSEFLELVWRCATRRWVRDRRCVRPWHAAVKSSLTRHGFQWNDESLKASTGMSSRCLECLGMSGLVRTPGPGQV